MTAYLVHRFTTYHFKLFVVSAGITVVLVVVVPLGYINLNNNIIVQQVGFVSLFLIAIVWTVDLFRIGMKGTLPVWGGIFNQTSIVGTVMFNYAAAVAVPSWCNEKVR